MQNTNPFTKPLENFYSKLVLFKHHYYRIEKVLLNDVNLYANPSAKYIQLTSLALTDLTGPTDEGWIIKFPAKSIKITKKDEYETNIQLFLDTVANNYISQSFELIEKLLKDIIEIVAIKDENIKNDIITHFKMKTFDRKHIKCGDILFLYFDNIYNQNITKLIFDLGLSKVMKVIAKVRHSIIHSSSIIDLSKINSDKENKRIFDVLFKISPNNEFKNKGNITVKNLEKAITEFSNIAFQYYKGISLLNKYNIDYETDK